ncbi:glycoside hydrolase family 15 protein [Desulfohalobium retbaense]|uniref:Glycoside hydrolase 15-related protein n=1 Tax=Desulfohalobium retbaense (strain ATCC 49708 / DSM 5692 / JCM 16813 / HR100) TaxID=485915 RepID=C8X194_DESRD|nr:glycoside hydrolase family 15 protein [Desulfohalobium retbaense]ACV68191.1 glycoside hydrolase 15-related protein [Desulfohalobium retbaense DSM 5692]
MQNQPIEDYGIIGDLHTVALVGINGSIDWMCVPRFDSPSVFGALLDAARGGAYQICPEDREATHKQLYWPETNVLITRFLSPHGAAELADFMPIADSGEAHSHQLIRRLTVLRGTVSFVMRCRPAFDYGRTPHETELTAKGVVFRSEDLSLGLAAGMELQADGDGVWSRFTLEQGHSAVFVLRQIGPEEGCGVCLSEEAAERQFRETVRYWRRWLSSCTYSGRWRESVHRSALALKLLTYAPTGAIVAAPTTSLPEALGGERNWDYRYTWIRDSAFTVYAFLRLGFTDEAEHFMGFLSQLCTEARHHGSPLQIMYGIDGRRDLPEEVLDHVEGYAGSRPVRVGNAAYTQLQLDIYGELLDAVYLFNKHGAPISYDLWRSIRSFVDWVCANWHRPDEGIWEMRSGQQHFVYSRLMCWVAIDRGLRLAEKRSFPCDRQRWLAERDRIYEDILTHGWSEERQAFVQAYGSQTLDASNLIMPLVFFTSPTDPRMLKTLDATLKPPEEGGLVANSLVHRYNLEESPDGLDGEEGTFNICTFWLVEALTRAGRFDPERLEEARLIFERMLGFANHVGLYAEETGARGEALGNFPQAFTHLALISSAFNLDRALSRGHTG